MEGTQCITSDYNIYSFKSISLLTWPDILQDNNVFEFIIHFNKIAHMNDIPIKVIKNNRKWYKYIYTTIKLNYYNTPISQPDSLDICYDLLVEYEFNKYKTNTIMLYMKINLLRDYDYVLPDIANHMKKLIC